MFEAGKKYIFSRTAFWNDMQNLNVTTIPWWLNSLDGRVFVGLGDTFQKLEVDGHRVDVLPEWCIDGEVELI